MARAIQTHLQTMGGRRHRIDGRLRAAKLVQHYETEFALKLGNPDDLLKQIAIRACAELTVLCEHTREIIFAGATDQIPPVLFMNRKRRSDGQCTSES